jgi:hypothetical protein
MEEMTLRFPGGLVFIFWPKWDRVAVVSPFKDTVTLSFNQFRLAIKMALKDRKKRAKK